mgnify:CR=1 FL=1
MRPLAVLALTLAGCASLHGPLDVITPDELTVGRGNASGVMSGGYSGHQDMYDYEGESESTYVALTWDIPSFVDPTLSRDEWRSIREGNLVASEPIAETNAWGVPTVEGESPAIPTWLPLVLGGIALIVLIAGVINSRKQSQW